MEGAKAAGYGEIPWTKMLDKEKPHEYSMTMKLNHLLEGQRCAIDEQEAISTLLYDLAAKFSDMENKNLSQVTICVQMSQMSS